MIGDRFGIDFQQFSLFFIINISNISLSVSMYRIFTMLDTIYEIYKIR